METNLISNKNPLHDRNLYIVSSIILISIMGGATIAPILPDLAKVFEVSPKEIELVMTIFFLPIGIATPILGIIADRIGLKKVLIPSLLLFAIAGGCASFAQDFPTLLGWRFLQGLGVTSLDFIALTMISMMYRGKALTTAMSINVSLIGMSTAIYPIIGGALAGFSWRYPFLLSVSAFPLVMMIVMVLKLPPKRSNSQSSNLKSYLQNTWQSINNPEVLGLLLAIGSIFAIQSGAFMTYIPIMAGFNFNASGLVNGVILGSMSVSLAVVASQLGRLARHTSEITLIKVAFLIMAIALVITPTIHNAWMLILPSTLFGVAQALAIPSSQALLAGLATDNTRAGFMAVNASVQSLSQAAGPLIAGICFGLWGIQGVFWVTAGISLATIALFNFLLTPKRKITYPPKQLMNNNKEIVSPPNTLANAIVSNSATIVDHLNLQIAEVGDLSKSTKTLPAKPLITQSPPWECPTEIQPRQRAWLLHLPSEDIVELPTNKAFLKLGKTNEKISPDINLSIFPNSEVVSRIHANIHVQGDLYYLQDMGSANGTYLNRYPLLPRHWYQIRLGDRISFGKGSLVTFIFQVSSPELLY